MENKISWVELSFEEMQGQRFHYIGYQIRNFKKRSRGLDTIDYNKDLYLIDYYSSYIDFARKLTMVLDHGWGIKTIRKKLIEMKNIVNSCKFSNDNRLRSMLLELIEVEKNKYFTEKLDPYTHKLFVDLAEISERLLKHKLFLTIQVN
ncbi:hypothetical protein [Lewinella cohaerens]|uniref:hypothetical protein n=1 Tax=Lewinella cohaerens TaxID=70995 RepID=UPI0003753A6B|nr:hypothetical protein [Lewinella cohaerens]